ncbi:DUF2752 domain-containing protein [Streptomonospora salina]|uniref:DUF2752 domain-containing protein n=1 Tax=Streptomonospora salina TaxID=104205 RepID=A0A841E903_9ACTN|nr:DUF2752 domain-containing protein [Streptomonospora salina]MBB5997000.1 hypothetical protein [Streptomonospora salina]
MSTSRPEARGRAAAWALPLRLRIEDRDRHRPVTYLALAGLAAGAAMAVFGLPPVDLHSPLHYMGVMMPTCGATRAVWAAMGGDLAMSLRYNPLGIVLVGGAIAALLRVAAGALTGRWVNVRVVSWRSVCVIGAVLLAALWINQQLHVDLLMSSPEDATPLATAAVTAVGGTLATVAGLVAARSGRSAKRRTEQAPPH